MLRVGRSTLNERTQAVAAVLAQRDLPPLEHAACELFLYCGGTTTTLLSETRPRVLKEAPFLHGRSLMVTYHCDDAWTLPTTKAVSYTHQTLPTILHV